MSVDLIGACDAIALYDVRKKKKTLLLSPPPPPTRHTRRRRRRLFFSVLLLVLVTLSTLTVNDTRALRVAGAAALLSASINCHRIASHYYTRPALPLLMSLRMVSVTRGRSTSVCSARSGRMSHLCFLLGLCFAPYFRVVHSLTDSLTHSRRSILSSLEGVTIFARVSHEAKRREALD